jgi:uncharacterized phiE125 gp8 family phage protein
VNLTVKTPPTAEPVDLETAKAQLRVDQNDEDALIIVLIAAARQICEAYHGQAYVTRTYTLTLDAFPKGAGEIRLPYPPAQSITSVKYDPADGGGEQTVAPADYQLDATSKPARLRPAVGKTWPGTLAGKLGAVRVEYLAGYGNASAVPEYIRQAILVKLADLFEHRESEVPGTVSNVESVAVEALLGPTRVYFPVDQ